MTTTKRLDPEVAADVLADGLMRVREAASFAALSVGTIYALADEGLLPVVRIGGTVRIPRRGLLRVLDANLQGGEEYFRIMAVLEGEADDGEVQS